MMHTPNITGKQYPSISADEVAEQLQSQPDELEYWAWPQTFGSSAGPFPGVGGQSMTRFTVEAWHDGGGLAVIFCNGRIIKKTADFEPGYRV